MKGNNFLSIVDLKPEEVGRMVESASRMKHRETSRSLEGKTIALLFEKPSLRTRVSFEVGIQQLGGRCFYLSRDDVGLGVREPESDVAGVLDRMVDGVVARVFSHKSLEILAADTSIPIINALSDLSHPCQAVGDLLTMLEHKGDFRGLNVGFVGDGNNISGSLALACSSLGANFTVATPTSYKIPDSVWEQSQVRSLETGSEIQWVEDPQDAVRASDVVYTDVWISMGDESEREERLKAFKGYQVDELLFAEAKPDAIFMHDMPAHRGEEISENMLDHSNSVVYQQAENRLHAQKALLLMLIGSRDKSAKK